MQDKVFDGVQDSNGTPHKLCAEAQRHCALTRSMLLEHRSLWFGFLMQGEGPAFHKVHEKCRAAFLVLLAKLYFGDPHVDPRTVFWGPKDVQTFTEQNKPQGSKLCSVCQQVLVSEAEEMRKVLWHAYCFHSHPHPCNIM